ncbi:G-type lectin S-receptor-like serine/threonine-protein kinase [Hibiscus syriacus]|uniref:non-specific serine/threonine protein kinase n=1 Tax=Hibiscus syriacus TaxID=106335 RepID=A0A6A3C5G3_HIBSY|nr:G-type lectin S-receptor-like serine/threonine-protein kinase [Hibiscus syriacus]
MAFLKFSASVFLLFLLFSLLSVISRCDNDDDDSASMAKLASALQPLPQNWSTNSSSSYCEWPGVKCDSSMHVLQINLNAKNLYGSLPSEFPPFPSLQILRLSMNKLTGSLPSLTKLPLLKELHLNKNKFKTIPPGFFQGLSGNLQVLILGDNPFLGTWMIPLEFSKFRNLTAFYAYSTNLEGYIPDIFDSLSALTNLSLHLNNLTGSLPPSFSKSKIKYLNLHMQKDGLTGTIDVLSNMTCLSRVRLQYNRLTGSIPDLSNCKTLETLDLQYNNLTGVFPPSLISHPRLEVISVNDNRLQGRCPSSIIVMKYASILDNNYCTYTGDPCDFQVTTLLDIASAWMYPYKLSLAWEGNDACRNWSFVTCDREKNITTVDFRDQELQGTISPAFGDLTKLEYVYLNDNDLAGFIPESLTRLPNLKLLDVSNNNLSGIIPCFAPSVKLITSGNDLLIPNRASDPPNGITKTGSSNSPPKGKKIGMIAGIVIATIIGVIFCIFVGWRITRIGNEDHSKKEESCPEFPPHNVLGKSRSGVKFQELQPLDYGKLVTATNNFHPTNVLGKGGFGLVYKGKLQDGQEIAVKRLSRASGQGLEEFTNEATVISKLQHRNLVRLLGCCIHGEEKMLVYEYMPNKSLDVFLFDSKKQKVLDWRKRFNIIVGISRGLLYLHRDSRLRIVHRDLKASNVLLDEELNPKISDFGIAKIFCGNESQANTRRVFGTYGYMSPEYAMKGLFSEKSDVFSFGVLTLEIVSGRRNSNFQDDEHSLSLMGYAWKLWSQGQVSELIDSMISSDLSCHREMLRCIQVGLLGDDDSDDSASMAKLAAALRPLPPTWSTNSSFSYCKWHGVKCASSMHVVEFDLNDMALGGSLPSEFPPFPCLQVLRLSRNKFKTIPAGFFQGLSGNLQVLILGQNPFLGTWTIPLEFTKFRNLSVF